LTPPQRRLPGPGRSLSNRCLPPWVAHILGAMTPPTAHQCANTTSGPTTGVTALLSLAIIERTRTTASTTTGVPRGTGTRTQVSPAINDHRHGHRIFPAGAEDRIIRG